MAKRGINAGFSGRTVVETVEVAEGTELLVRGNPHRASSKGRGAKRPQPPLSREAVLRFLKAAEPHVKWLEQVQEELIQDYEQSCREQIRLRTVVKPGYVRLEIEMRPGKPEERCLDLAAQVQARLDYMREVLEENGLASGTR